MSQSLVAGSERPQSRGAETETVTDGEAMDGVLELLEDADCRAVLSATADEELTVSELGERFDIPQSTAYRKVEALADAGLLEETVRISASGNHASAYACRVEAVSLSVDDEGVSLDVTRTESESQFPSEGDPFGR